MYTVTTGSMMHVHGGFGAGVDYTVRLTVHLDDEIDEVLLRAALDKTQQRYPYLSVTMKRGEGAFYYVDNKRPITLIHGEGRVHLNEAETNFHVWSVSFLENRLHLDIYHGITDGTGMYRVLATLLYYYCAERYGVTEHEGIGLAGDPIPPEETGDPQDTIKIVPDPDIPATQFSPAFTLETDGSLTPSVEGTIWDVEIPEDAFIRFTSDHDSSPGTMISVLVARAIDRLYPDRDKHIVSAYVINARPMLHAEQTFHNCLGMAAFDYDQVKGMPLTRQCTIYRGKTFAQSDDRVIRKSVALSAEAIRKAVEAAPTVDAKKEIFTPMFNGGDGYVTFLVSYTGKWAHPALGEHMREFWPHAPNTFSLMVEINAAGGRIFLSIQQRFKEDTVREAILEQLRENGIPYQVHHVGKSDIAYFREPE